MAGELSLLFNLKAQNQASPAIHTVQSDITKLSKTTSTEFNAMQSVATSALGKVTASLTNFGSQLPIVGTAVSGLSSEISTMAGTTAQAGTQLAAIAGPIGLAAAAAAAFGVAIFKVGEGLFQLAQYAADAQGKLFDLSQQTGVSVETLATLDVLAQKTGGSIESISASLGIFQKNIQAAKDPTTKMADTFKRLGVDSDDTEVALRQVLQALAEMPESAAQTTLALELFGRSGKQLLAILKETHGDIGATTRELQKLGLANTKSSQQADEFLDKLVDVKAALLGIAVTLGNRVIPDVLKALNQVETGLKNNQVAIDLLGKSVSVVTFLFAEGFKNALGNIVISLKALEIALTPAVNLYERLIVATQKTGAAIKGGVNLDGSGPQVGSDTSISEGLTRDKVEKVKATKDGLNRALEREKFLKEEINRIDKIAREIDKEAEAEAAKRERIIQSEIDSLNAFIRAQTEALRGQRTALEQVEDFIQTFGNVSGGLTELEEFWIRFRAIMLDSRDHVSAILKQLEDIANLPQPPGGGVGVPESNGNVLTPEQQEALGTPPSISAWEQFFGRMKDLVKETHEQMESFTVFLSDGFRGAVELMTDAVKEAVFAWALYGESIGQAIKKAVAATLAGIAAEAVVQALYHAAFAIGKLALGDFAGAGRHALAAAKFGAVAAAAGLGAKAVAGGAFSQSGSDSSGESSSSRNTPKSTNQQQGLAPIDIPRSASNQGAIVHTLEYRVKGDAVVDRFVQDYNLNGRTRVIITSDGQG